MPGKHLQVLERLLNKVIPEPNSGCWLWTGALTPNGYAVIQMAKAGSGSSRNRGAHRVSFELHVGAIPQGFDLDHLCRVRCCVNPAHLEPVTRKENLLRGVGVGEGRGKAQAARTHCPHGHPYDEANTKRRKRGGRDCRECDRLTHLAKRRLP